MSGLTRVTAIVLVGVAAVGAASTVLTSDDAFLGTHEAGCLLAESPYEYLESWIQFPVFGAELIDRDHGLFRRTMSFPSYLTQSRGEESEVGLATSGGVTWLTINGEHRAQMNPELIENLAHNLRLQQSAECDQPAFGR